MYKTKFKISMGFPDDDIEIVLDMPYLVSKDEEFLFYLYEDMFIDEINDHVEDYFERKVKVRQVIKYLQNYDIRYKNPIDEFCVEVFCDLIYDSEY